MISEYLEKEKTLKRVTKTFERIIKKKKKKDGNELVPVQCTHYNKSSPEQEAITSQPLVSNTK